MKIVDAFRAQYFITELEEEIDKTNKKFCQFNCFSKPFKKILQDFSSGLFSELDQLLLPTIVFEIHKAKQLGELIGDTPRKRYESFFVRGKDYTPQARSILDKYPFLFELVDGLICRTFESLSISIQRFLNDQIELRKWLSISKETKLSHIQPVNGADRHRNQQTLLFIFSDGVKVIYKPVDLNPDLLFTEFIKCLNLNEPYDLKTLEVLPKKGYGWIKFIERKVCNYSWEIENFYRRTGVLLAVSDALNYTDGHYENLIADGQFPVLIDGETFFQNCEAPILEHKNILSTLLIQKSNFEEENRLLNSALQAPPGIKLEYLNIHAIHDHTDEIEIRYFRANPSNNQHCPVLVDLPSRACDYVEFLKEGYCIAYRHITSRVTEILNNESWWEKIATVQARTVLRETISYLYLQRKIQAEGMTSCKHSERILFEKLGQTPYTNYEISDLLKQNIPYFYHYPGQKHLYNGNNFEYSNAFTETAVERLKHQFLNRSEEKMNFDCKILQRHLIPTSIDVEESVMM